MTVAHNGAGSNELQKYTAATPPIGKLHRYGAESPAICWLFLLFRPLLFRPLLFL